MIIIWVRVGLTSLIVIIIIHTIDILFYEINFKLKYKEVFKQSITYIIFKLEFHKYLMI